jgi:hypothetical protein
MVKATKGQTDIHKCLRGHRHGYVQELQQELTEFLGAFAKLQTATISFVMSVHLSARNNSAPTGQILITLYLSFFQKSVEKMQVSLESTRITGALHEDISTFMTISC